MTKTEKKAFEKLMKKIKAAVEKFEDETYRRIASIDYVNDDIQLDTDNFVKTDDSSDFSLMVVR